MIWIYVAALSIVIIIIGVVLWRTIHAFADLVEEHLSDMHATISSEIQGRYSSDRKRHTHLVEIAEMTSRNLEEVKVVIEKQHDELGQMFTTAIIPALGALIEQQQRAIDVAERTTPRPEPVPFDHRPSVRTTPSADEGNYVTWEDIRRANQQKREMEARQRMEAEAQAQAESQPPEQVEPSDVEMGGYAEETDRRLSTDFDQILRRAQGKENDAQT